MDTDNVIGYNISVVIFLYIIQEDHQQFSLEIITSISYVYRIHVEDICLEN